MPRLKLKLASRALVLYYDEFLTVEAIHLQPSSFSLAYQVTCSTNAAAAAAFGHLSTPSVARFYARSDLAWFSKRNCAELAHSSWRQRGLKRRPAICAREFISPAEVYVCALSSLVAAGPGTSLGRP